jgi:hypothetical protein
VNTLLIPQRAPGNDLPAWLHRRRSSLTEVSKNKLLAFRTFEVILSLLLAVIAQQTCLAQAAKPIAPKPATPSESQNLSGWLQYIALELKKIRLELIQERYEKQQTGLSDLERELQLIRDQQREIEEEQNAEAREPVEIDSQLAQPGISKEQREELEARKADLLSAGLSRFAGPRSALAQREAQVRERIAGEQERIQRLARQAQDPAPAAK